MRLQGIEVVDTEVDGTTKIHDSFRVSAAIKILPPFSDDIEQFFESVENVMEIHKFPLYPHKIIGKSTERFFGVII